MEYSIWKGRHKTTADYWKSFEFLEKSEEDKQSYKDTLSKMLGDEEITQEQYDKRIKRITEPHEYFKPYFTFDEFQLEIDPDETKEDFENYDEERQEEEITKCRESFPYFAHKYARILHAKKGLIPFILFNYQRRTLEAFENERFNLISKFRQGGLTTLAEIWSFWRCTFKFDQQILFLSKTDREAIAAGQIVNRVKENLPSWMLPPPGEGKWNDHVKQFPDTGGQMGFFTPEASRGLAATYLILDEAAFIDNMDFHWKGMYPVLSTGGNCIVVSTVNGIGNWYHDLYKGAKEGRNNFNVIDLDYWEHPDYDDEHWVKDQKAQLGKNGWDQEVLRSFLGSGQTYIPGYILTELQQITRKSLPKRKVFSKYVSKDELMLVGESDWDNNGALWVWEEPRDGREYIIGVDVSEGVSEEGDNSCIQIIDSTTLEQVAEFYSDCIPPYIFSQICNELGIHYNHALMVVENMGPGGAVVSNLQHELFYDNLYFENQGKSLRGNRGGIKVTPSNRPLLLETMQHRIMNNTMKINSMRFVNELNTFIYDPKTDKVKARKGNHDDAIMALCFALYVRDSLVREVPIGGDTPEELKSVVNTETYQQIKSEIMDGSPRDFIEDMPSKNAEDLNDEMLTGVVFNFRRKYDKIFRQFGWVVNPYLLGLYGFLKIMTNLVGNIINIP